ncbi:MAG: hypothetical protein M3Y42_18445 [Actinomycetota bacterium]|nr:hypothetical protein [Actinomycetota bacterium]MDQ2958924.1 hypothetical protein [Actinomycetota bacterium]
MAWRNSRLRQSSPVGLLDFDGAVFTFRYLSKASTIEDFRPFIGFPNLDERYQAKLLWPFFALRVMDERRPDFPQYLQRLGLPSGASQLDILSRNSGERKGDKVQLVEEPQVGADGRTEAVFLVRGTRYATEEYASRSAVQDLQAGDRLELRPEASNQTNSAALLITTAAGSPIGWVPDPLIGYMQTVFAREGHIALERNNGPDAPWHLRLLARVSGQVSPGYRPFTETSGYLKT